MVRGTRFTPTPPKRTCMPPSTRWPTSSTAASRNTRKSLRSSCGGCPQGALAGLPPMSMRLIIVSGLSGSARACAAHAGGRRFLLRRQLPAALLKPFISYGAEHGRHHPRDRRGLDARNRSNEIETIGAGRRLARSGIDCEVLYLHAADEVLLKRFAETRRKHPLVAGDVSLREAIASGTQTARAHHRAADWVIDTSNMGCMRCARSFVTGRSP